MRSCLLIAGLGFGDEGKGSHTDWAARFYGASLVVRYNGGPQNSHTVTLPDGRYHTFRQFGSATFVPDVRTHLSEYVLVNPIAMMIEEKKLSELGVKDAFARLTIHSEAVVITPYQRSLNMLTEIANGSAAHGSCGHGLGVARQDSINHPGAVLRASHIRDKDETATRLKFIEEIHSDGARHLHEKIKGSPLTTPDDLVLAEEAMQWFDGGHSREFLWHQYEKFPTHAILPDAHWNLSNILLAKDEVVIFEGSQGALLDEDNKEFYPHVTWTNTTYRNALQMINSATEIAGRSKPKVTRIGCLRPYATRHGAGPLPREDSILTDYMRARANTIHTEHNKTNRFQGSLRYGFLDLALVKRAIYSMSAWGGVDQIAMSCMDHLIEAEETAVFDSKGKYTPYKWGHRVDMHSGFVDAIQKEIGVPITVLGYGPAYTHRFLRITD